MTSAGDAAGAAAAFADLLMDCLEALGDDHPHTRIALNSHAYWLERADEQGV